MHIGPFHSTDGKLISYVVNFGLITELELILAIVGLPILFDRAESVGADGIITGLLFDRAESVGADGIIIGLLLTFRRSFAGRLIVRRNTGFLPFCFTEVMTCCVDCLFPIYLDF